MMAPRKPARSRTPAAPKSGQLTPIPSLFSGDRTSPPLPDGLALPESTSDIPWLTFAWQAVRYDLGTKIIVGAGMVFAVFVLVFLSFVLPKAIMPLVAVAVLPGAAIVGVLVARGMSVKAAFVLKRDAQGAAYIDRQEWWKHTELPFPDTWRWTYLRSRLLFLDSLDPDHVIPLNPWLAPLPTKAQSSPSEIAQARLLPQALRAVLRLNAGMSEVVKTALYIGLMGASLLAVYLAAQEAIPLLN